MGKPKITILDANYRVDDTPYPGGYEREDVEHIGVETPYTDIEKSKVVFIPKSFFDDNTDNDINIRLDSDGTVQIALAINGGDDNDLFTVEGKNIEHIYIEGYGNVKNLISVSDLQIMAKYVSYVDESLFKDGEFEFNFHPTLADDYGYSRTGYNGIAISAISRRDNGFNSTPFSHLFEDKPDIAQKILDGELGGNPKKHQKIRDNVIQKVWNETSPWEYNASMALVNAYKDDNIIDAEELESLREIFGKAALGDDEVIALEAKMNDLKETDPNMSDRDLRRAILPSLNKFTNLMN